MQQLAVGKKCESGVDFLLFSVNQPVLQND